MPVQGVYIALRRRHSLPLFCYGFRFKPFYAGECMLTSCSFTVLFHLCSMTAPILIFCMLLDSAHRGIFFRGSLDKRGRVLYGLLVLLFSRNLCTCRLIVFPSFYELGNRGLLRVCVGTLAYFQIRLREFNAATIGTVITWNCPSTR